jgi:hypothetical protein
LEGERSLAELKGQGLWLEVESLGSQELRVRFPLDGGTPLILKGKADPLDLAFASECVAEMSLPLAPLGVGRSGEVYVGLRLIQEDKVVERAPLYHLAQLEIPADHDLDSWTA